MKNVLITGGAGFVPSSLADGLLAKGNYKVVLVDNMLTGNINNVPKHPNCQFIKADANNYEDLAPIFGRFGFHYVFHYAAVVGVKRTLDNPVMVLDDITGFKNILNLSKNSGVERVFFSSSSEVYGEPVELPQNEVTTPLNSKLPYAIVKNVGEAYYIDDNIDACINALENDKFVNDVVNIGNDQETTILELAKAIIEVTKSSSRIVHLPALEEGDMTRRLPDITSMKTLLNRDLLSMKDGIKKVVSTF